jgi:hypothetical protein
VIAVGLKELADQRRSQSAATGLWQRFPFKFHTAKKCPVSRRFAGKFFGFLYSFWMVSADECLAKDMLTDQRLAMLHGVIWL